MKILILRFSSIGDIVLTTPVIRALKTQRKDVEVHFATKKAYHEIIEANPHIDKIHLLEGKLKDLTTSLKKEKFDRVIDLHNNLRTAIVKARLGVTSYSFHKLNWEKYLYVRFKINTLPSLHIVDRYMKAVEPLGVVTDSEGLDYFIPHKDEVEKSWLPHSHQRGYVAVVVGAKYFTKQLPLEKVISLCDKINKPIVLVGGKEDIEFGQKVEEFFKKTADQETEDQLHQQLNKKSLVFNACGKFSINQSASIIKNANYVFTNDTGFMHIAAAFKKIIYCYWGNTTPLFGMYPYRTKFTIFENNKLSCRPCSKIGYSKCPKGHFKCMRDLDFDFYLP